MEAQVTGESIYRELLELRNNNDNEDEKKNELHCRLQSLQEDKETLLWDHVFALAQDYVTKELAQDEPSSDKACALVGLVIDTYDAKSPANTSLLVTAEYLHGVLPVLGESKLKDLIVDLCTKWCTLKFSHWERMWTNTFVSILKASLRKGAEKKFIGTVYLMRDGLENLPFLSLEDPEQAHFRELLAECATSPNYLRNAKGKQFITYLLKSKPAVIRAVYRTVDKTFPYFARSHVESLASCFLAAWKSHTEGITEVLEESIQDIMLTAVNLDEGLPRNYHENLYKFLNVFHAQRSVEVSQMLFRLYRPILWRGLKVPNCVVRKSAARIFFDAFPLSENYQVAVVEAEMRRQSALIQFLLQDPYPDVRVETIRGTMKAFSRFYGLFPHDEKKKIMNILVKKNGQDWNSMESRKCVINGLSSMIKNVHTHAQLKALMPLTKHYLNDTSAAVRAAYLSLLYAARKIHGFKFIDVAGVEELADLLATANRDEARLIVQVLRNSFFNPGIPVKARLERRFLLVGKNPRIADRLYYGIARTSDIALVLDFVLSICASLHRNFGRERRGERPPYDSDEGEDLDVTVEDVQSERFTEEELIVLVDTLAVMFTSLRTRSKELQNEPHKRKWKVFHIRMKRMLRSMLKKVTTVQLKLSCLYMASQMPDTGDVLPMIGHQCMTMLQQMMTHPHDTDPRTHGANIRACLYTVCRARKAGDILSSISDSLEQIQACQEPTRKVRFRVCDQNPQVGLGILQCLLEMKETVAILFKSHLVPLFDIWSDLLRILTSLREKLCQQEAVSSNEKILLPVFGLYLKISIMLSQKKNPANQQAFDSAAALSCQMDWIKEQLLPLITDLPGETQNTSIKYVKAYLESSADVFKLNWATQDFADSMVDFMQRCKTLGMVELNACVAEVARTMEHMKIMFATDEEKEASVSAALASLCIQDVRDKGESTDSEKENRVPVVRKQRKRNHASSKK